MDTNVVKSVKIIIASSKKCIVYCSCSFYQDLFFTIQHLYFMDGLTGGGIQSLIKLYSMKSYQSIEIATIIEV